MPASPKFNKFNTTGGARELETAQHESPFVGVRFPRKLELVREESPRDQPFARLVVNREPGFFHDELPRPLHGVPHRSHYLTDINAIELEEVFRIRFKATDRDVSNG